MDWIVSHQRLIQVWRCHLLAVAPLHGGRRDIYEYNEELSCSCRTFRCADNLPTPHDEPLNINEMTDFRMIPMGEIDLQHEIPVGNKSGLVYRRPQLGHTRRMYSANVEGRQSSKTVAIYQGDGAEEVC
jgi:hypothetical protein